MKGNIILFIMHFRILECNKYSKKERLVMGKFVRSLICFWIAYIVIYIIVSIVINWSWISGYISGYFWSIISEIIVAGIIIYGIFLALSSLH